MCVYPWCVFVMLGKFVSVLFIILSDSYQVGSEWNLDYNSSTILHPIHTMIYLTTFMVHSSNHESGNCFWNSEIIILLFPLDSRCTIT